jgi:beta-galactosidase/beta-glucuronidase
VGVVDYSEQNPRHWQPRGKQVLSAFTMPSGMMYTGSSGIWDSVWAECVPAAAHVKGFHPRSLRVHGSEHKKQQQGGEANVDVVFDVELGGDSAGSVTACVEVLDGAKIVAKDCSAASSQGGVILGIAMPSGAKLWTPDAPFLYNATVSLLTKEGGKTIDTVRTYFGHRTISTGLDKRGVPRVLLNGKPYYLIGPLDQGWFPDGLYSAATDEALRFDLQAMKTMGMNSVRKVSFHIRWNMMLFIPIVLPGAYQVLLHTYLP